MVLRSVKPLDEKQWKMHLEQMKKGQSKEMAQKLADARERARKIHKENF